MIVDTHAHVWRRDRTPQPWIDPVALAAIDRDFWLDDLATSRGAAGIDATVLVQTSNSADETRDLLALVDGETVLGVVGWIDLEGDVPSQVRRAGRGLVGVRHLVHQDADDAWLVRETVGRGFDALADIGLPFDLVVRPDQLAMAASVVAAHSATRFVLDHLGKPPLARGHLDDWRAAFETLAAHPNVTAKVSGLVVEASWTEWTVDDLAGVVDVAVADFGADRLMFGTDWPVVELAGGVVAWKRALDTLLLRRSDRERAAIMGGTARDVYRWDADA